MAEKKPQTQILEREYIIPLRKAFLKAPRYDRTRIAIREIKRFLARHMKVEDRDHKKIKIDIHLNNEIWFRGRKKPPAKIKVKAIKQDDIVKVDFVEVPQYVKFHKIKVEKHHKAPEKKKEKKDESKTKDEKEKLTEEKKKEESEEKKKEESEKSQATAEQHMKQAEQAAKAQKHIQKAKQPQIHRKALKK